MAVAPRRHRRRPYGALLLLGLLISVLGWVLYLRVTDQPLRDPFGFYRPNLAAETSDEPATRNAVGPPADGMVRVLVSARNIQAYSKVTRDDLFDGARGMFAFLDIQESFVEDNDVLVGTSAILGRVMARNKRPGFAFTEADFLPEGTRPGITAGIPPGKRALRIDVDLVRGIIGLNPGDRFDIIAARTIEPPKEQAKASAGAPGQEALVGVYADLVGGRAAKAGAAAANRQARARVDVIVQGGVVVSGMETRLVPTSSASLTAGQITGTRPVQEMVIALAPEEVGPLVAAMRLEADLTSVARSGRPEDPEDSITPGLSGAWDSPVDMDDPESPDFKGSGLGPNALRMPAGYNESGFTVIEAITGGKRTLTAVPSGGTPDGDGGR